MLNAVYMVAVMVFVLLAGGTTSIVAYERMHETKVAQSYASQVGMSAYQELKANLRTAMQNSGGSYAGLSLPAYAPISLCPGAGTCPYTASATYTYAGSTPLGGGGTAVQALNQNLTLNNQRIAYQIRATVTDAHGVVVGQKLLNATFQTVSNDPWVKEVGLLDANGSALIQAEGDSGGCDPASPTACDTKAVAAVDDTRMHVNAQCSGDATECSWAAVDGYKPVDNYSSPTWNSTNANTSSIGK